MKNIFSFISQKERRILGLLCLILGVALFFYVFFSLGIKRSYTRSLDFLSAVQRDLQTAETSEAQKSTESQKWELAQQDIRELRDTYFYSDLEWMKELRMDLQRILETSGIQDSRKKFEYVDFEKEEIRKVIVDFTITGRYMSLKNFIHAVESFQKFLVIEKIDFLDIDPQGRGIKLRILLAGYHAIF
ncbi:MAG: hypothetical protein MUP98_00075 [Candidatus Aminicenantes bacterium]|nr:hypothetical protein [Candidatus Aminicenantes bacterium]